jgi:hypothetical protein
MKLHIQEIHNLYSSINTAPVISMAGHMARIGRLKVHSISIVKPEGKRPLGRPMHIRKHNIKDNFTRRRMGVCLWI